MKKVLILLLIVLLVGCSGNKTTNTDNSSADGTKDEKVAETKELTFGSDIDLDGYTINFSNNYSIVTLENQFSELNGANIVRIPVHVKNNSGETGNINMFYLKYFGSKGTQLDGVSTYFDNSLEFAGELRNGAEYDAYVYMPYDGDGDYIVAFDNYKVYKEVVLPIKSDLK